MKKIILLVWLFFAIAGMHMKTFAQCGSGGTQFPAATFTPTCGVGNQTITNCIVGGQYALVDVILGNSYTFSTCGSTWDTQITLFNNGTLAFLGYNDDNNACGLFSLQSSLTWVATFTGVVRVKINLYNCLTNATCGILMVSCVAPITNDNCATATAITPNVSCIPTAGTTVGATQQFPPTICSGFLGFAANEVWYTFTADGVSSYTINVTGGASVDAVLGLYSACATGNLISCMDFTLMGQIETINAGILPAGTYYYRIYDYWGSTGPFTTCVVRTAPLPIELLSFTASCDEQIGSRKLQWVTASEINNDYFTIERSFDAINWLVIRTVAGAGNSNVQLSYSWTDTEPLDKPVYYRLSQTDFNGQSEIFNPVYLSCHSSNTTALIWPNPNDGGFNLRFSEDAGTDVLISLTDNFARVVLQRFIMATGSDQIVSFNEQLVPGVYYLTIRGKVQQTLKVVIQ